MTSIDCLIPAVPLPVAMNPSSRGAPATGPEFTRATPHRIALAAVAIDHRKTVFNSSQARELTLRMRCYCIQVRVDIHQISWCACCARVVGWLDRSRPFACLWPRLELDTAVYGRFGDDTRGQSMTGPLVPVILPSILCARGELNPHTLSGTRT